jgi:hypothetical protein
LVDLIPGLFDELLQLGWKSFVEFRSLSCLYPLNDLPGMASILYGNTNII